MNFQMKVRLVGNLNKKKEESKTPIDVNLQEMQARIAEWETNLAQSGGLNE